MTLDDLGRAKYISVTTMRRDGSAVATPVWLVREADALLVTTQGSSGKVKRIRNNPSVMVAPCDARGRLKGDQVPGMAHLQDPAETERTTMLIRKRYGLLGWLFTRRGKDDRQGITITLA
ncbi:MAG: PPOX class F420-dependent oxidoreductase [Actinomycetales bacterium]